MRILVDENIPLMTVRALRELRHEVMDVRGTGDEGVSDAEIWGILQRDLRLLVTTDKGFARRRFEQHSGILIVRLHQPNRHRIHQRVMQAIAGTDESDWPGLLVTMRDTTQSVWRRGE